MTACQYYHVMLTLLLHLLLPSLATSSTNLSLITHYIRVPVDHFSFADNATFLLRYLCDKTNWRPGGPLFFYPGNEGAIDMFAEGTGFLWEIAPRFGAMVVFAEHRYYGESLPFGADSLSGSHRSGFLTSGQALADYATLLRHLRDHNRLLGPAVAFGGSYGGMLAAWLRLKFPSLVLGAVASSAPVWMFDGLVPCNAFNAIVTRVYGACKDVVKASWSAVREIAATEKGRRWLTKIWKLCKPLDLEAFIEWLAGIYGDVAMVNYPYEADFLTPLPANPVEAICAALNCTNFEPRELVLAIARAISIYTNYTGTVTCNDLEDGNSKLGEQAWDFQACTEMVMPMCSTPAEMFEERPWDRRSFSDACYRKWGVRPDPQMAVLEYGGTDLDGYTNVVFSNGLLDPWSAGGVLRDCSETVVAVVMPDAAHHLDLRAAHPADPRSVREARLFHAGTVARWLEEYYGGGSYY